MLLFGHLGIGKRLALTVNRNLPLFPLLVGTLLPDLIDKPVYYGLSWITQRTGNNIPLFTCTRTLGHTCLFLLLWIFVSKALRARKSMYASSCVAITAGIGTHLFLDLLSDGVLVGLLSSSPRPEPAAFVAFLYPLYLPRFSISTFSGLSDHASHALNPFNLACEIIGLIFLFGRSGFGAYRTRQP